MYDKKTMSMGCRYYYSFPGAILIVKGGFRHLSITFEYYGLNVNSNPIMNTYMHIRYLRPVVCKFYSFMLLL